MRIAVIIHSLEAGGAERVATILANEFSKRGNSVFLVTFESTIKDHYRVSYNVKRVELNISGTSYNFVEAAISNFKRLLVIRRFLREHKPNVIIAFTARVGILCLLAAFRLKIPVIIREAIYPPTYFIGAVWEKLRRLLYPKARTIVMQTEEGARWIKEKTGLSNVCVIPNPIILPLPMLHPHIRPDDVLEYHKHVILAVGRLDFQKGFDILIEAVRDVLKEHENWDLVILGEGPERNNLEGLVLKNNLKGRVHLVGKVGNIGQWYERAEIFVLTSRFEGFPNALLEAMAYGCAVISLDCKTGPKEIIKDRISGLLVDPKEAVTDTASALRTLIQDNALREKLSKNAKSVRSKYHVSNIVDEWEKIIFME